MTIGFHNKDGKMYSKTEDSRNGPDRQGKQTYICDDDPHRGVPGCGPNGEHQGPAPGLELGNDGTAYGTHGTLTWQVTRLIS
jgi:hypothetical protein